MCTETARGNELSNVAKALTSGRDEEGSTLSEISSSAFRKTFAWLGIVLEQTGEHIIVVHWTWRAFTRCTLLWSESCGL